MMNELREARESINQPSYVEEKRNYKVLYSIPTFLRISRLVQVRID